MQLQSRHSVTAQIQPHTRLDNMYTFTIDEDNAVHVFDAEGVKIVFQPDWPDYTPFADAGQATSWAEQLILSMTDETADLPGDSPEQPTKPRPAPFVLEPIPGDDRRG